MSDLQRGQLFFENLNPLGSSSAWNLKLLEAPALGLDGAIHIFVATTGVDDNNDGLAANRPLKSIQAGLNLATRYVDAIVNVPVVVEVANGTYTENIDCLFSVTPRKRIIVRGDIASQTIVASGIITSADAISITDSTAAFAAGSLRGLTLHVFDPSNKVATERWISVRSHNSVTIKGVIAQTFGAMTQPLAGWRYEVLTPAVIVTPLDVTLDTLRAEFPMPAGPEPLNGAAFTEPILQLAWISLQASNNQASAITMRGGVLDVIGVVLAGTRGRLSGRGCKIVTGTPPLPASGDPVFGIGTGGFNLSSMIGAVLASKPTAAGAESLNIRQSVLVGAGFVLTGLGASTIDTFSNLLIFGGAAVYSGRLRLVGESIGEIVPLNLDVNLPVLFSGQTTTCALEILDNAFFRQFSVPFGEGRMEFENLTVAAVRADRFAAVELEGSVVMFNCSSRFLDAQRGGRVALNGDLTARNFHNPLTAPPVATDFLASPEAFDLTSAITLANEELTDINTHIASVGAGFAHLAASPAIGSPPAFDLTSLETLLNDIKATLNTHYTFVAAHLTNDTFNTITAANAVDLPTSITLANQIRTFWTLHSMDEREIRADGTGAPQGQIIGTATNLGSGAGARTPIVGGNTDSRVFRDVAAA
jgi:hypothetical protein